MPIDYLYTLGIPTYNRIESVQVAIAAALSQNIDGLEIIVSDNGNSRTVKDLCEGYSDPRLRYVAQETNIGTTANFCELVRLARGKYFSWLQDDDGIVKDFASRAVNALESECNAHIYTTFTWYSDSFAFMAAGTEALQSVYGPPFPGNWLDQRIQAFDGRLMLPLALLTSVAIPPTIAFRTDTLRLVLESQIDGLFLLDERRILAEMGLVGTFIVDPFIGGVLRRHEQQASRTLMVADTSLYEKELGILARWLDEKIEQYDVRWEELFEDYLQSIPDTLVSRWCQRVDEFDSLGQAASTVRALLRRRTEQNAISASCAAKRTEMPRESALKKWCRACVPPVIWRGGSMLRRACRPS